MMFLEVGTKLKRSSAKNSARMNRFNAQKKKNLIIFWYEKKQLIEKI